MTAVNEHRGRAGIAVPGVPERGRSKVIHSVMHRKLHRYLQRAVELDSTPPRPALKLFRASDFRVRSMGTPPGKTGGVYRIWAR